MEMNKEAARISKEDFDSLCPFCKSLPSIYLGSIERIATALFGIPIIPRPKSKSGDAPSASDPLSCFEQVSSVRRKGHEIEDGRVVPMTKRPTKTKKLEAAFPPRTMTTEEKKEQKKRMDQGLARLGLFIITVHLQKFVENRSLQAVFKEHDLVVSWDDEKKKAVVVTCPRQREKSKKG